MLESIHFPIGHKAITLTKNIDPLQNKELPKGSEVIIEGVVADKKSNIRWVTCKANEGLWDIRPGSLEVISEKPVNSGRYFILKNNNKKI